MNLVIFAALTLAWLLVLGALLKPLTGGMVVIP